MTKKTTANEVLNDTLTAEENAEVEKAAAIIADTFSGSWKYELKEPLEYMEKSYTELEFDFDKLTGEDIANIERELEQLGLLAVTDVGLSDAFAERAAALACVTLPDTYAIEELWGADFNNVIRRARMVLTSVNPKILVPKRSWEFKPKKPLNVGGKEYDTLVFDYKKIKGRQLCEIVSDLESLGLSTYGRNTASYEYAVRVAAAACSSDVMVENLKKLDAPTFCAIVLRARVFLMGIAV